MISKNNTFDKEFSFLKLFLSLIFHVIVSVTAGPLIAAALFILWLSGTNQGGLLASFITEESLVGYWFVIIVLLMFGLVWLGFFNNRKDPGLSSIKCYRWWTEFWMNFDIQSEEMPNLPEEGEEHFKVKIIKMDIKFPIVLGLLILSVMSIIIAIIIYSSREAIQQLLPEELQNDNQWILGFSIAITIAILSAIVAIYFLYKHFFTVNKNHFYWRRFWLGLILYSMQSHNTEFSIEANQNESIINYIDGFKTKYNSIASIIDKSKSSSMSLEYKLWLENKLEDLDSSPSFLIPKSWSVISAFYGFTLVIAGSLGELIAGPASTVLRIIADIFI